MTNQSDKEVQLYKISHLDFMVRRQVNKQAASAEPSAPVEVSAKLASSGGGATIMQKVARIKRELVLDESLPMATAVKQANEMMGIAAEGPLPAQVDKLLEVMGA